MIKNNDKILTTSFDEKELFDTLREICHDLDWPPDELVVRPDFYKALEIYSAYYDNDYLEYAYKNPNPTYYGIKIKIKNDLDKPFKFMRGGKEINAK